MSEKARQFARFVPAMILRELANPLPTQEIEERAKVAPSPAVVLFADISGYSKLADQLAELGKLRGPEELWRMVNTFYEPLVSLLDQHGGDVIGFAGDAALAVWSTREVRQLRHEVVRAAHTGLTIVERINGLEVAPDVRLSLRISIGAGELLTTQVGGIQDFWQLIATGPPLDQIRIAEDHTRVGSVVLSPQARELTNSVITGEELPGGHLLVRSLQEVPEPIPVARPDLDSLPEDLLRPYIPAVVQARIDAGQGDWLADLRRVTVLFVRILSENEPNAETLQMVMAILQRTMARYRGLVLQMVADDKGMVAVLALGLPPFGHEDDATRGVWAAQHLHYLLRKQDLDAGIGIATGVPFCGPLGGTNRCCYTTVGRDVIRAARLMQCAGTSILCDEPTRLAARDRLPHGPASLLRMPLYQLKGFKDPVRVHRVTLTRDDGEPTHIGVGRQAERKLVEDVIQQTAQGHGKILLIEGEAGVGKSHLADVLLELSRGQLERFGQVGRQAHVPHHPWAGIWSDILNIGTIHHPHLRQQRIRERFGDRPGDIDLLPLLDEMLGALSTRSTSSAPCDQKLLQTPETAEHPTALHNRLLEAIQEATRVRPVLILLEDAHTFGPTDWALIDRLAERVGLPTGEGQQSRQHSSALTIVMTTRPQEPVSDHYRRWREHPETLRIELPPLSREEVASLARDRSGASQLGNRLVSWLNETVQGNPRVFEEEWNALLRTDALLVKAGQCELTEQREEKQAAPEPQEESQPTRRALFGRQVEREQIHGTLDAALAGESRVLIIEGETGIGKTRLLEQVRTEGTNREMLILRALCTIVEGGTPYHPWRKIVGDLIGLPAQGDNLSPIFRRLFQHAPELEPFAPLLNDFLGVTFPENEIIRQLSGEVRADNFHDLVIALIESSIAGRPLVITLDDAHWADAASWRLGTLVRERIAGVALVLGMQPPQPPIPPQYEQCLEASWGERISLTPLTRTETHQLTSDRLRAGQLSERLSELIWGRSLGNPLFIEEVVAHLSQTGLVNLRNGTADLKQGEANALDTLPDTIRGLVTCRVDRLALPLQLTIKISSVFGQVFHLAPLLAVHPDHLTSPQLQHHLTVLINQELIDQVGRESDPEFNFRHAVVRQVCYELLPATQRRVVHQKTAEWFQHHQETELVSIAHHWGEAGFPERQAEFTERAGEVALQAGAYREAVSAYEDLLRLSREQTAVLAPLTRSRSAHWKYQLGQAYFGLGDLPTATTCLRQSLRERSWPVKQSTPGIVVDILTQALVQLLRRWDLWRTDKPGDEQRREAASTYARLAQITYFNNEKLLGANATIRTLNVAESAGRSPVLAHAYATMCITTGILRWHRIARLYARLAETTAREVNHLPTLCTVLMYLSMYHLGQGNWEKVESQAQESLATAERLGDRRQATEAVVVLAMLNCFRANYSLADRYFEQAIQLAQRTNNTMHHAWGLNGRGECLFRMGRSAEAVGWLQEAAQMLRGKEDLTEEIRIQGLLAAVFLDLGDRESARRHAEAAEEVIARSSVITSSTLEGFASVAEVRLNILSKQPDDAKARSAASTACKGVWNHAQIYPIGRPRAFLHEGTLNQHLGKIKAARRAWQKGLQVAQTLRMPLEITLLNRMLS